MLKDLRSLNYDEMSTEIINLGFPKFRVNQIFSWVHEKCVNSFFQFLVLGSKAFVLSSKIINRQFYRFRQCLA
mgnify:CR=1 FL=1